ncbi:MAG: hypothetical protein HY084_09780 [Gemmatimonadetes bacterium]|nr:hypothetical protein [Gemmatimonadota bacterium]
MPLPAATLRFPHERVLLHRTRLAYVHLGNLLTDAKRDRAARVYGYVAVWLPEELLLLYLQEGEVVNATSTPDGAAFHPLAIAEALAKVPNAAEIGEICFHEADDEQLATMFASQSSTPMPWPQELAFGDSAALLAWLHATMHDGVVEVQIADGVNYAMVRNGVPVRGYFADPTVGKADAALAALLLPGRVGAAQRRIRLWPVPPALPVQAPPALVAAYRELVAGLVRRLGEAGATGVFAVAENARHFLSERHPALQRLALGSANGKDPTVDAGALTAAVAAWMQEIVWASPVDAQTPEQLLGELTRDRRHVFQSAGLFQALPWRAQW